MRDPSTNAESLGPRFVTAIGLGVRHMFAVCSYRRATRSFKGSVGYIYFRYRKVGVYRLGGGYSW